MRRRGSRGRRWRAEAIQASYGERLTGAFCSASEQPAPERCRGMRRASLSHQRGAEAGEHITHATRRPCLDARWC